MSKVYDINGSTFVEDDNLSTHNDDTLANYELYKVLKMPNKHEDESEDEDMRTELDMHIQKLPHGVIINSNVFLWDTHWHTMALVDGNVFCCAVCRMYCDKATLLNHIDTDAHCRNLDEYKPLKRFDLSIVRKINENFHCGVCNEIFDIIDYKIHENSKTHEGNLLTAINKVSDLMYDSNIQRDITEKTFHSNNRNMQDGRSTQTYAETFPRNNTSEYHFDANAINNNNAQSYVRNITPETLSRNNNSEFHFDANAINNNNFQVYEDFSDSDEEEYEFESEEYNTPSQGVSYASMASKPTMELPKFLKIDLGTKEVRVKLESWHMIIKIELNKFYCMVCNKKDHIRFRSQHCISCEHIEKLAKCTVVKAFEDYLIRKVGDKLYHCGHCNNLQYQDQMMDHIESAHPKKMNVIDTTQPNSPLKTIKKCTKTSMDKNISNKTDKPNIEPKSIAESVQAEKGFDVFGDLTVSPFGTVLKISALAFNFIMKKGENYYCAICDKPCADVKGHVKDMEHVELMTMTPFIRPFKCNLTRAVRGTLHCSLCNELLSVSEMYSHNLDPPHTTALAAALGMRINYKPDRNAKKTDLDTLNQKVEQNKAAGTSKLPSEQNTAQNCDQNLNKATGTNLPPFPIGVQKPPTPVSNLQPIKRDTNSDVKFSSTLNKATGANLPPLTIGVQKPPSPLSNMQNMKKDLNSDVLKLSPHSNNNSATSPNSENISKKSSQSSSSTSINSGRNGSQFNFNAGTNFNCGSNLPNSGQNKHVPGLNMPYPSQNLNPGQNAQNYPAIYNAMLPILRSQNLNNFLSPPLNHANFNAPRAPYRFPFTPGAPLNQNISDNQSNSNSNGPKNQKFVGTKSTEQTPTKRNIESANETIKNKENIKSSNNIIKPGNDNIESANDTLESLVSQSDEDELKQFDEEESVFVKIKTTYFKITNLSYNTLIYMDNGIRHCFVCSNTVRAPLLRKHVESREHTDNIAKNKFLDKYGVQLFRQMYLMYHCAICNVLMTRKEIKLHLDWPIHIESYDVSHIILNKKNRKELKSGIKEYVVETQKEAIFHNVNEPKISLVDAYQIVPNLDVKKDDLTTKPAEGSKATVAKKNKMVIINNVVMKVGFDHWHGITSAKNVTKCIICQMEIRQNEVLEHVQTEYHAVALGRTFEKTYYPHLVRKINESAVNCMICNLELPNNEYMIHEHVNGRRHNKNREGIVNESSSSESYADCYEDYLTL